MKRFLSWLGGKFSPRSDPTPARPRPAGAHLRPHRSQPKQAVPRRQPEFVEFDGHVAGHIEELGPGKNVLVRNRYVREDTGTHETLRILDESGTDGEKEAGFDPYNTGNFDRSRNWEKRRK